MLVIPEYKILFVHIHKNAGKSVKAFLRRSRLRAAKKVRPSSGSLRGQGVWRGLMKKFFPGRTAGPEMDKPVWVREWKGSKIYGHESLSNLMSSYPEFESYFRFTVVRDPWDRLLSAYCWIRGKPSGSPGLNRDHLAGVDDFSAFVRLIYKTFKLPGAFKDNISIFYHPRTLIDFSDSGIVYPAQVAYIRDVNKKILTSALVRQENLKSDLIKVLGPVFKLEPSEFPDLTRVGPSSRPGDYTSLYDSQTRRMVEEIYAPDMELFGYEFGRDPVSNPLTS